MSPSAAKATPASAWGPTTTANAYISILGKEDRYLTDSHEALRTMIRDIKAGKADHLL
jgi:hypothetical protein